MKIKSITIEGMHNVVRKTYDFDSLAYLHGPNGAGKSTVMQAIQLALLGYIPGTAKTKAELFRHANNHTMAVSLTIDDNGSEISVRRVWTGTSSSINSTVDIRPDGYDIEHIVADLELPIFNFNTEFMNMTANKLKDWFIEFLPSMEVKTEWPIVLKEKLVVSGVAEIDENLIKESVSEIESYKLSGIDEIRKANEYFKSMLSFKKKEAERIQHTVQSLIFYEDIDSAETVEEVQKAISEKRDMQHAFEERRRILANNEKIRSQISLADDVNPDIPYYEDERYKDIIEKISELESSEQDYAKSKEEYLATKHDIESKIQENTSESAKIFGKILAKEQIISEGDVCPFTKKSCDSISTLLDDYRREIEEYTKSKSVLESEQQALRDSLKEHTAKFESILEERNAIESQIRKLRSEADDIKHRYATVDMLKSQIVGLPDVELFDVSDDIKILEDKLVKLKTNQMYSQTIDTLTSDKYKVENEIASYKYWIELTGVNGLQNMTGDSNPFTCLEGSIDVYLKAVFGDGVTSKFNLVTKANSFNFGIERNHSYIPFNLLSSGEKCLYTLALMLSLVKVSKSPLKIVMVDDLLDHLDDVNIVKLFKSLKKVKDIQMIFAGVKPVDGEFTVEVN